MSMNKVLLFTADDALAVAFSSCLVQSGYIVVRIASSYGAINLIQLEQPAVVILDIALPDFNSLAIIRDLRSLAERGRLPVILMGVSLKEEDALLGLEVGADLCLRETFHPQVFLARLRSLLRRYEALSLPQ